MCIYISNIPLHINVNIHRVYRERHAKRAPLDFPSNPAQVVTSLLVARVTPNWVTVGLRWLAWCWLVSGVVLAVWSGCGVSQGR